MTYKVIESKKWKNKKTGKSASIYGAVPYYDDITKRNWEIITVGFTVKNTKTGIVGIGKKPCKTYCEAESLANKLNERRSN